MRARVGRCEGRRRGLARRLNGSEHIRLDWPRERFKIEARSSHGRKSIPPSWHIEAIPFWIGMLAGDRRKERRTRTCLTGSVEYASQTPRVSDRGTHGAPRSLRRAVLERETATPDVLVPRMCCVSWIVGGEDETLKRTSRRSCSAVTWMAAGALFLILDGECKRVNAKWRSGGPTLVPFRPAW